MRGEAAQRHEAGTMVAVSQNRTSHCAPPSLLGGVIIHLLRVGWRNFFYSCPVVSVFGSGGE
jgi:hypothetical protein